MEKKFVPGTICWVDKASPYSMGKWKLYHEKFSFLICPCRIGSTQRVIVTDILSESLRLVQYYNDASKLSVVGTDDLRA